MESIELRARGKMFGRLCEAGRLIEFRIGDLQVVFDLPASVRAGRAVVAMDDMEATEVFPGKQIDTPAALDLGENMC